MSNAPPVFTSAGSATFAENGTGTVYTATASDANGDALTFTLSGTDAARFSLSGTGALTFVSPPNFDLPTDANMDNAYDVTVNVSDGKGGSASLPLAINVTNDREGIAVKRIATGLANPSALASNANGAQIVVGLRDGTLLTIDGTSGATISTGYAYGLAPRGNSTLLGIARGFKSTPLYAGLFVVSRASNGSLFMTRDSGNLSSEAVFTGASTLSAGAAIGADANGQIFVAVGDPSGDLAQGSEGFGKLFRIDPNPDPYAGASPRFFSSTIVGKGIREPVGMAVLDGKLIFSDRGGSKADELNVFPGSPGANYGWPFEEGTTVLKPGGSSLPLPILEVLLGTGERQSSGIVGPAVYSGPIASLKDMIVAADKDGTIWSYPKSRYGSVNIVTGAMLEVRTKDFAPDAGTIDQPVAIAVDANGTLYILDGDGELFRVDAG